MSLQNPDISKKPKIKLTPAAQALANRMLAFAPSSQPENPTQQDLGNTDKPKRNAVHGKKFPGVTVMVR